eukprot:357214-Alexandrium_andersonii.AAC.1
MSHVEVECVHVRCTPLLPRSEFVIGATCRGRVWPLGLLTGCIVHDDAAVLHAANLMCLAWLASWSCVTLEPPVALI